MRTECEGLTKDGTELLVKRAKMSGVLNDKIEGAKNTSKKKKEKLVSFPKNTKYRSPIDLNLVYKYENGKHMVGPQAEHGLSSPANIVAVQRVDVRLAKQEDVERLLLNVKRKEIPVRFEMEEPDPDPQTLAEKLIILIIKKDLLTREIPKIFRKALLEIPFVIKFRRSEDGIKFLNSIQGGKDLLMQLDGERYGARLSAVRSDKTHPFAKSERERGRRRSASSSESDDY